MDIFSASLTIFGYSMGLVEFAGTLANAYSVWLMAKLRITTWPVGILGSILFAVLFYKIRLYGDFIEQLYYLGANFYGWAYWLRKGSVDRKPVVTLSPAHQWILIGAGTVAGSLVFGFFLSQIHILFPDFFGLPAEYPYLDGLTTAASFVAMVLMARGRLESWIYWIIINILSVGLYSIKSVYFIALLYAVYLVLAVFGLYTWLGHYNQKKSSSTTMVG